MQDQQNDWSAPFAVALGGGAQLVVLDLADRAEPAACRRRLARGARSSSLIRRLAGFAGQARFTFAADHQPILGFSATEKGGAATLVGGNLAIQSVFGRHGARQLPPGVDVLLSGHYHLWQQVGFSGDVPSQFITGFSGTLEDVVPLARAAAARGRRRPRACSSPPLPRGSTASATWSSTG